MNVSTDTCMKAKAYFENAKVKLSIIFHENICVYQFKTSTSFIFCFIPTVSPIFLIPEIKLHPEKVK